MKAKTCNPGTDDSRPVSEVEFTINNNFRYHPPKGDQPERYEKIRENAKLLAELIAELCPGSRERSIALTNLETAVMWANAAIARNE